MLRVVTDQGVRVSTPIAGLFDPIRRALEIAKSPLEPNLQMDVDAETSAPRRKAKPSRNGHHRAPTPDLAERAELRRQLHLHPGYFRDMPETEFLPIICEPSSVMSYFGWTLTQYRHAVNNASNRWRDRIRQAAD